MTTRGAGSRAVADLTVLITGGTRGLGLACAQRIRSIRPQATLIVTGRNRTQGQEAVNRITATDTDTEAGSRGAVLFLQLDLLSQKDVRRFASLYSQASYPPLQALLLNAGMQSYGALSHTEDGYAAVFAANHLNQFLLFHLLRPHFALHIRVAVVSSGVHDPSMKTGLPEPVYHTAEQLAHPLTVKEETGLITYSTSKLCNVYFTRELHRRSHQPGQSAVQVNAINPGLMPGTGLARQHRVANFLFTRVLPHLLPLLRLLLRTTDIHTAQHSAIALTRLALDPEGDLGATSGCYFNGLTEARSSELSYDDNHAKDLWDTSVRLTAQSDEERRAFAMQ